MKTKALLAALGVCLLSACTTTEISFTLARRWIIAIVRWSVH